MKKKIFFIMSTDDYSGAEAVNFSIIDGLRDKYDFYWVSKSGNINNYLVEKNIKWIEIKKLSVSEIKRIVREKHPDILHATDFKASVICALANTKVPLIEHLHNNAPWIKKINIKSLMFLYSGLKANKILTVSDSIKQEYIFSNFINKKVECISNPVSRKKILSLLKKDDYKKEYDICCVARITEAKNPLLFINVVAEIKKQFPNIRVVWVGEGELRNECEVLSKKLKVNHNIEFVGHQKNPYQYMARSKIFMLTSKWEGYGLVAFEALTLGLPCVVSDVGGLPEIVDDTCGKLCHDSTDYKVILDILNNQKLYDKLSINAIKKSKKIENYSEYIVQLEKIYNQC